MVQPVQHLPSTRDLAADARSLGPWFHNIQLPGGVQTAPDHALGSDFPGGKWQQISRCIPESLEGWSALDVGCNAGFYSVELARRGARVVGLEPDTHYLRQARWVVETLQLSDRIELRHCTVYELLGSAERFDLILFMGVFYHLRHPLLALDLLASRLARLMIVQTLSMPGQEVFTDTFDRGVYRDRNIEDRDVLHQSGWPKMSFIEHQFAGDPSNWWIPNHAGIEAMLRSSGLRIVSRPGHELYACEPADQPSIPAREELAQIEHAGSA
jgi:tRNA (mo5U34)-methyltransferase